MPTKFKDVAHLYLPFLAIVDDRSYMVHGFTQSEDMFQVDIDEQDTDWWNTSNFTPVLKSLYNITDEHFFDFFNISRGVFDGQIKNMKRISTSEISVILGYGQYLFGFIECHENDCRLDKGYSFYLKEYLIKDEFSVSESGLEESKSFFNNGKDLVVKNQITLMNRCLQYGYDLFGLIESGEAKNVESLTSSPKMD